VLGHIDQLAPILAANADVIAVMQAGFIGGWGEWHGSTNDLDNPEDQKDILDALLAALPASRQVQVRTPMAVEDAFPGGPMAESEAHSGSARSRVGHHNDCFLASATDYGTYASPVAEWETYVSEDGRFTAIGGETCAVYPARSDCEPAMAEMESNHWSYLNSGYHQTVLATWQTQGCYDDVRRRLGYRFELVDGAVNERVAPGGELVLQLRVANVGFAAPYNHRPVEVVLTDGSLRRTARLSGVDARRWAAGETTTLAVRVRIPADVEPGSYTLAVRLPDESDSLADDSRYAIRFANDDVWDDETGDNVLMHDLVIDAGAPGPRDPEATSFTELH
jgi:hypothetical protein